jgi:hypothetical protein
VGIIFVFCELGQIFFDPRYRRRSTRDVGGNREDSTRLGDSVQVVYAKDGADSMTESVMIFY